MCKLSEIKQIMKKQTAVSVNPIQGGTTSLDLAQLKPLLDDGWLVNSTCASSDGAILIILEKEQTEG
jgi:hypothetical protein